VSIPLIKDAQAIRRKHARVGNVTQTVYVLVTFSGEGGPYALGSYFLDRAYVVNDVRLLCFQFFIVLITANRSPITGLGLHGTNGRNVLLTTCDG